MNASNTFRQLEQIQEFKKHFTTVKLTGAHTHRGEVPRSKKFPSFVRILFITEIDHNTIDPDSFRSSKI
jgi:hypothetical protein